MDFQTAYQGLQDGVQSRLRLFFDQKLKDAGSDPIIAEMFSHIRDLTLRGGKRLRPALLLGSYLCFSSDDTDSVIAAGTACELMQSSLIIHDDIMDQSEVRRGGPTLHRAYEQQANGQFSPGLSSSLAILAGNTAGYLGLEMLEQSGFPLQIVRRVTALYGQIMVDENHGQALDIYPRDIQTLSEADVLDIYRYKTSRYTTEFPLMAGALFAGQEQDSTGKMMQAGIDLGIAFQIQDDILGVFGDEQVTGKSTLSDLAEGKKTLLAVQAYVSATEKQKDTLKSLLGRGDLTQKEAEQVRRVMRETGALDHSRRKAAEYFGRVRAVVDESRWRSQGREWLLSLIALIEKRKV
ncbi:hypothetical protein AUK40_03890 [Candidatus Wirthbacteria bacterium CG2_30_54_11]|uniref:Polyprenyl synthetase n=1 Tax=Candidatus Wirthbacteria bacterium CG2_30_54_11 TaxID=1817892 RepID=A0A1J5IRV9_9BACT|nr:MAG: hypothetical protein AUK40_03890 [Candidatus Wirthbacteria bacterium CG2_30_54_11]